MTTELMKVRDRLHAIGESVGVRVWIPEKYAPALKEIDDIRARCLDEVLRADALIAILELEVFAAALAQKAIHVFRLNPWTHDVRLEGLLSSFSDVADSLHEPMDVTDLEKEIGTLLRHILDSVRSTEKRKDCRSHKTLVDGSFLGNQRTTFRAIRSLSPRDVDLDRVRSLIDRAGRETVHPTRLISLWTALRNLASEPYWESKNSEILIEWIRLLRAWASSAAWYGLHGNVFLGRLAAVNGLHEIRNRIRELGMSEEVADRAGVVQGALASEYYSLSKMVSARRARRSLRQRALNYVNEAFREAQPGSDLSGFYAVRGTIKLAMRKPFGALKDFGAMLNIRKQGGHGDGAIGEAEVKLGLAYCNVLRFFRAQTLIESGVARLEANEGAEFTANARKNAARFYKVTLRKNRAVEHLLRAREIAVVRSMKGQLVQIDGMLQQLGVRLE